MKTIGIAGGGQLGRMLTDAAHKLGYKVIILDATPNSPAGLHADEQIVGAYKDANKMRELAEKSDIVTFEVESVNAQELEKIAADGKPVHPVPQTLSIIKDKLRQKAFLSERNIPVADFVEVHDVETAKAAGIFLGYPYVLKARSGGFDGRGNFMVKRSADIKEGLQKVGTNAYAERFVPFQKELAVVAARRTDGKITIYPLVETIHKDHICLMTLAPAPVSKIIANKAHAVARKVLKCFDGAGVFGIEMFLSKGNIIVNEVAPRVHNSGHWTIEGAKTSQFEQHIRAITDMPLGSVKMKAGAAVMINILGNRNGPAKPRGIMKAEKIKGVKVHIYGKIETRKQRKMGHITAVASSMRVAKVNAEKAQKMISI